MSSGVVCADKWVRAALRLRAAASRLHANRPKNRSGGARTLLAAVDELASVGALSRGPLHVVLLEVVAVVELDLGDRRTTSRVVDDVLHDTADVAVFLGIVGRTQAARTLAVLGVGGEDGATTLALTTDDTTLRQESRQRGRQARATGECLRVLRGSSSEHSRRKCLRRPWQGRRRPPQGGSRTMAPLESSTQA